MLRLKIGQNHKHRGAWGKRLFENPTLLTKLSASLVFLSVLALLLVLLPKYDVYIAKAAPLAPHVLYGQVKTQDGTIVASGLSISARISNIHYGQSVNSSTGIGSQSTKTHSADSSGFNYGTLGNFQICADDPSTSPREGGQADQTITFYVDGIKAQAQRVGIDSSPVAGLAFAVGKANQRVDLIIPSLSTPKAGTATASNDACTTAKAATAPTATPTPAPDTGGGGFFFFVPAAEEEVTALGEADKLISGGSDAGAALANLAKDNPEMAAEAVSLAFAVDPDAVAAAFVGAGESNSEAAGALLIATIKLDVASAASLLNAAAALNSDIAGTILAAAAAADPDSAALALIAASNLDSTLAGLALAKAADTDSAATGAMIVSAAKSNLGVMAQALLQASTENARAIGEAIVQAGKADVSTTVSLLLEAGKNDPAQTGKILIQAAGADPEVTGLILLESTKSDLTMAGSIVIEAASVDPKNVGAVFAAAAGVDAVTIGSLVIQSGKINPIAISNALAEAADLNPVNAGLAIAEASVQDQGTTGTLLTSAINRNATAIGNALGSASKGKPGPVGAALASGPAQDKQALSMLGSVIPVEPWMPEAAPLEGSAPSGDGVWQKVSSSQSTEAILIRYNSNKAGAGINQSIIPNSEIAVAVPSGRLPYKYMTLEPENFEPSDVKSAHVTMAVDKSWLTGSKIHEWSVQFNRFDPAAGEWRTAIAKRLPDSDGSSDQIKFSIGIGGFSLWAISGGTEAPGLQFRVDIFNIPDNNVKEGEIVVVEAEVTNLTQNAAEYQATLWLDSQAHFTQSIKMAAGQAGVPISFEISANAGSYQVRIDRHVGSFTVGTLPTPTPTPRPTATPTPVPEATVVPTATPAPVETAAPSTPVPPAATPIPEATAVPSAPVAPTATATAVPPTAVPPTPAPTKPTATAVPPKAVPATKVTPTATPTPAPPSEGIGGGTIALILLVIILIVGAGAYLYLRRQGLLVRPG